MPRSSVQPPVLHVPEVPAFWMLRRHYERGDTRADAQYPAASALVAWWTREYDAVCEAFVE